MMPVLASLDSLSLWGGIGRKRTVTKPNARIHRSSFGSRPCFDLRALVPCSVLLDFTTTTTESHQDYNSLFECLSRPGSDNDEISVLKRLTNCFCIIFISNICNKLTAMIQTSSTEFKLPEGPQFGSPIPLKNVTPPQRNDLTSVIN